MSHIASICITARHKQVPAKENVHWHVQQQSRTVANTCMSPSRVACANRSCDRSGHGLGSTPPKMNHHLMRLNHANKRLRKQAVTSQPVGFTFACQSQWWFILGVLAKCSKMAFISSINVANLSYKIFYIMFGCGCSKINMCNIRFIRCKDCALSPLDSN